MCIYLRIRGYEILIMPAIRLPYTRKFLSGENFANFTNVCHWQNFCTVKILTHSHAHTYAHSSSQAPPTTSWKVTRTID